MVVQMEDVIDLLITKFGGKYQYVLLVDHSNGRDRQRANVLNATKINAGFGGAGVIMHETELLDKLDEGPFHYNDPIQIKVGDK